MVEPNYENLPAPMGFTIDVNELDLWNENPGDQEGDGAQLGYAFRSDSMDVVYGEMSPGTKLPWHTHEPHTSQLYWILEGTLKTNYKDNEGRSHSVTASADEQRLVFLPAGAHNQLESVGDSVLRFLSIKDMGGTIRGRLEHFVGDTAEHYDPKADPQTPGLDILPRRGEVFDMDEDATEEW